MMPTTPDLRAIESFVLVVREGSLTRAEAVSGVSKATISRQITRLEEDLGTQLLARSSRRVVLTEAGRAWHAHCSALLAEVAGRLETARTTVQNLNEGVSGTLSLLSDIQFATTFVCHVVRRFLEHYPDVRCALDIAGERGAPRPEQADCHVCTAPPDHPNLAVRLLGRLNYSLYASPDYLARHGVPQTPGELQQHRAIVMRGTGGEAPVELHARERSHGWMPQAGMLTNDYWVMKTFCIDGFGIALMPDFFARPEASRGVLAPVLPAWRPQPLKIHAAYQRQRYMTRKLRAFLDLLSACVAEIDTLNYYVGSMPTREPGQEPRARGS